LDDAFWGSNPSKIAGLLKKKIKILLSLNKLCVYLRVKKQSLDEYFNENY